MVNSTKVTVSAPGKLVVLGDHAVVYGHPALVMAVGQRMRATAELSGEPFLTLDAPDVEILSYRKSLDDLGSGEIPKGAKSVEFAVRRLFIDGILKSGVTVQTSSKFSGQFGFGSSGASAVTIIAAVFQLIDGMIDQRKVFDVAMQSVRDSGSTGSGVDLAAAVYGGLAYFITGGKVIERLNVPAMHFVIGFSGVKVDTGTIVAEVKARADEQPKLYDGYFRSIGVLVDEGRKLAEAGDLRGFGEVMNRNQDLLEALGVGSAKLSAMIEGACAGGALGAKISGSGKGDCMIALCESDAIPSVSTGIAEAGGQVIDVPCLVEGLRLEK
ncbi:MAG: mevalonate kinase [Candidatus Peregrinibacteria bacterium]